jgi:hypothetical protein
MKPYRSYTYPEQLADAAQRHERFMQLHGDKFVIVVRADALAPGAPIPQADVVDSQKLAEAASWADQMRAALCGE